MAASKEFLDKMIGQMEELLPKLEDSRLLDRKMEIQSNLSQAYLARFNMTRSLQDLRSAIRNEENLLSPFSGSHESKASHLNTLSYMKSSSYEISGQVQDLHDAVRLGRQARAESSNEHPERANILDNLGYALSSRYTCLETQSDLDEAIECSRETVTLTKKDTADYSKYLLNLSSRLTKRFMSYKLPADKDEAMDITNDILKIAQPGSMQEAVALVNLSAIARTHYKHSHDPQDLDEAITYSEKAQAVLPRQDPQTAPVLDGLADLYTSRFESSHDVSDLRKGLSISHDMVINSRGSYALRAEKVESHLERVAQCIQHFEDPDEVQTFVEAAEALLETNETNSQGSIRTKVLFVELILQHYILTADIWELPNLVTCCQEIATQRQSPSSDYDDLEEMKENSTIIASADTDRPVRDEVSKFLYEVISRRSKMKDLTLHLIEVQKSHGQIISEYVLSINDETFGAGKSLQKRPMAQNSEPDLDGNPPDSIHNYERNVNFAKEKNEGQIEESLATVSSHDPYFGQVSDRQLAMDPKTRRMMWTFDPSVLGYEEEDMNPKSAEDFIKYQMEKEAETYEAELKDGKNPDPMLCRMCRRVEILNKNGFNKDSIVQYLPFGNYGQLLCRPNCSICKLILNMVKCGGSGLHPSLNAIDREVQGVMLHIKSLSPHGENFLTVEYGTRTVGTIRYIREENFKNVLRQGFEMSTERMRENVFDPSSALRDPGRQEFSVETLKRWLQTCEREHKGTDCQSLGSESRYTVPVDLIFIDVIEECLVEATSAEKYIALSYVW